MLALGLAVDPFADSFDFVIIRAELLAIDRVEPGSRFLLADRGLPGCSKHEVDLVVQVAALEKFPFSAVEPDAVAGGALVKSNAGTVPDTVAQHQAAAFGADLDVGAVGGGDCRPLLRLELGQRRSVGIEPAPIFAA